MIHSLLTDAAGVAFFTGVALRFSRLDEYYRKRARQNFKKRLQRLSGPENQLGREQEDNLEIPQHDEMPVHQEIENIDITK